MSNAKTARAFFEAYDAHDVERMLSLCAEEATYDYVPYGEAGRGKVHESAAGVWGGFIDAFPDFSVRIERVMETTDGSVVVEDVQGGTQAKEIMGIENKGRSEYANHAFILDFDGAGKISHIRCYWDNDTIYAQLGHTVEHE